MAPISIPAETSVATFLQHCEENVERIVDARTGLPVFFLADNQSYRLISGRKRKRYDDLDMETKLFVLENYVEKKAYDELLTEQRELLGEKRALLGQKKCAAR